jgi:hypothetical protein
MPSKGLCQAACHEQTDIADLEQFIQAVFTWTLSLDMACKDRKDTGD